MDKLKMIRIFLICAVTAAFGQTNSATITNYGPVASGYILEWEPDWQAVVKWSPDLGSTPFTDLSSLLPIGQGSYTDTVHGADNQGFYCIEIHAPSGVMVLIPAGEFQMGDTFGEGEADELPVHSVYVSSFYIERCEVTKALWDEVYSWAAGQGYTFDYAGSGKADNHPVHSVNWYDVVKWCNARSEMEGRTPCYSAGGDIYRMGRLEPDCNWSADGYRLPTEAEWEKAARGGWNGLRFGRSDTITHLQANYYSSTSYSYDVSATRGDHPLYDDGVFPYSSPVGSFTPNGYGMCDMMGNMFEFCWDWYDSGYYATSTSSNPRGASSGSSRVLRGGSWDFVPDSCRSAGRYQENPAYRDQAYGFRTVRRVD